MRSERYDFCILGAGAAGLYLADKLTRDGRARVAIIEAGARDYAARKEPYIARSAPREHRGINDARVTALGGATNTWGGGLIRMRRADLEALDGMPGSEWPLAYEDLRAAYEEVEADLGLTTPSDALDGASYAGGFERRVMTLLPFRRKNFARTFGRTALGRPNATLLLTTGELEHAEGAAGALEMLHLRLQNGEPVRVQAAHFVVAAGVVNSFVLVHRLLALLGAKHGSPLGRHFHDHLSIPLFAIHPRSAGAFSRRFSYRFAGPFMHAERYEGVPAAGAPGAFFHLTFEVGVSPALRVAKYWLERLQRGARRGDVPGLAGTASALLDAGRIGFAWGAGRHLYLPAGVPIAGVLDLELEPDAAWGFAAPDPSPVLSWDISNRDLEHARHYAARSRELVEELRAEEGFTVETLCPDPDGPPQAFHDYVRGAAWDTFHAGGVLRMGTDAARAVVDSSLALHGLRNVHVVSTAVFPRGGAANPTLTVLALGCRLCRKLRGA